MTKRKRAVEPLSAILPEVLRESAARQRPLAAIRREWRRAVGPDLASHTKPVSLRRGRLVVHVEAPGDSYALSYRRAEVLARLKKHTKEQVEELVIRAGEI